MAYSNYRGDWNRDRNERSRGAGGRDRDQQQWQGDEERDIDDARRARESMARDQFGYEGRGGYGGGSGRMGSEDQGSRFGRDYNQGGQDYSQRDYGQGDYGQEFGRGGEGRSHYGNESGGWQGREREQWRNRSSHGEYDRNANYGGYGSSGTGNYAGYGGSGGSYRGGRPGYGQSSTRTGRPSGGAAYGNYAGGGMGYGDDYGSGYGSQGGQSRGQLGSSQEQEFGLHRGRGPRGYRRSDDRIKEDVCDCLTEDDRIDATDIEIVVKDGEVQLTGFVSSREDKRWAEALAERISGVKEVQNSLRVQEQQRNQSSDASTTGSTATGAGASTGTATGTSGGVTTPGKDKGKDIQH